MGDVEMSHKIKTKCGSQREVVRRLQFIQWCNVNATVHKHKAMYGRRSFWVGGRG